MRKEVIESLRGNRVLITGGSKGIGASIAITFAKAGMDVAIVGRDKEGLKDVQNEIEKAGQNCLIIETDLSTYEGIEKVAQTALRFSSRWDILVNNAGIARPSPLLEINPKDFEDHLFTNLRPALFLSQAIVPQMIERKKGKIINISSVGSFFGTPNLAAYAISKSGLNQLTRTMAVEWGPHNIQTNAICPTIILTEMGQKVWDKPENADRRNRIENRIPLHRLGDPQDVSDLALFLASSASDYMNGLSIPLEGGMLASS